MSNNPKPVKFPNKVTGKLRIGNTAADYGVYGTGTVQKFELGTRYRQDDRVFRYGRAGSDINPQLASFDFGAFFVDTLAAAVVVGDMHITIATDGTSGSLTNGFGVKDNMVGGLVSRPDGVCKQVRRITGHVAAPTGTTVKVYLDGPFTIAVAAGIGLEFCPNPYRDLRYPGGTMRAVMGVAVTKILSGSFGWFQTWGPTWMVQNAAADFTTGYDTDAEFTEGGNLTDLGTNAGAQRAGFVMTTRVGANWGNPPYIFLQITP